MTKKSKTHKPAAPPVDECYERRKIADVRHADALNEMRDRCYGLDATIMGSGLPEGPAFDGLLRISMDVGEAMERVAKSFEAERKFRLKEEAGK